MIDEKRKNDLRDALLAVCNDRHMQNYAENLRLGNVPLCGDYADKLPYFDPRLERGDVASWGCGTSPKQWAKFQGVALSDAALLCLRLGRRHPGFRDSTNTNVETMQAAIFEAVSEWKRRKQDEGQQNKPCKGG